MKLARPQLLIFALGLSLLSSRSEAAVYTTGVSLSGSGGAYQLGGWSEPNATGNGAIITITLGGTQLSPGGISLGIGSMWYHVSEGELIDSNLVRTGAPFIGVLGQHFVGAPIQATPLEPFYLGFWLNNWEAEPNTFVGDRFGWAKLRVVLDRVELLSSAIEDTGRGIAAGSLASVPEPGSLLLLVAASALAGGRRRSRPTTRIRQSAAMAPPDRGAALSDCGETSPPIRSIP